MKEVKELVLTTTIHVFSKEQLQEQPDKRNDLSTILKHFYQAERYLPLVKAQIEALIANPSISYFAAIAYNEDNKPIGCNGLIIAEKDPLPDDFHNLPHGGKPAILVDGFVMPEARGNKLFQRMTTALLQTAREEHVTSVFGIPAEDGVSQHILEHTFGFTIDGTTPEGHIILRKDLLQ